MLRTVGIIVVVVILLMVAFALLSRFNWNPLERLATPPTTTAAPGPSVPSSVVG